jgi:glycerate kinase
MGAHLTSGTDAIIDRVGLEEQVARADVVVTGEGKLDRQTLEGKVPAGVARTARAQGKVCVAVAGGIELSDDELRELGFSAWASLIEVVGGERALKDPSGAVTEAAVAAFARLPSP